MIKDKIAKIIYDELCYMYCDNCRYNSEIGEDEPSYGCDNCHRKYNGWGISMAKANRLAEMAIETLADRPTGEWTDNHNGTFTCDQCGCKHSKSNYCPNCGAKMGGDSDG